MTEHRDGARGRHAGVVSTFDAEMGLGEIIADDGTTYAFHCIEIADGTRDIRVGTAVDFTMLPKLGRIEAADIRPR